MKKKKIFLIFMLCMVGLMLFACSKKEASVEETIAERIKETITETDTEIKEWTFNKNLGVALSENSKEHRAEKVVECIVEAAQEGSVNDLGNTIIKDSIEYSAENEQCTYVDSEGILYLIDVSDNNDLINTSSVYREMDNDINADDYAEMLLMYGIDEEGSDTAQKYAMLANQVGDKGDFTIDSNVTVQDYSTALSGKKIIFIETHGNVMDSRYVGYSQHPILFLLEEVTFENSNKYKNDLINKRVAICYVEDKASEADAVKQEYILLPEFFTYHYADNQLEGAYVYMGNCCGLGKEGQMDTTLADAFLSCGADVVTGYHNSVFTYYDIDMSQSIVSSLLDGHNISDAVDSAKSQWGYDDKAWSDNVNWGDDQIASVQEKLNRGIAEMYIVGSENWTLLPEQVQETEMSTETEIVSFESPYDELLNKYNPKDYAGAIGFAEGMQGVLIDITHDGKPELITVELLEGYGNAMEYCIYSLDGDNASLIYNAYVGRSHLEWYDLYLIKQGDEWYLFRNNDYVYGGIVSKSYELYYINENGEIQSVEESDNIEYQMREDGQEPLEFSDSSFMEMYDTYNQKLNNYLSQVILLSGAGHEEGTALPVLNGIY